MQGRPVVEVELGECFGAALHCRFGGKLGTDCYSSGSGWRCGGSRDSSIGVGGGVVGIGVLVGVNDRESLGEFDK